MKKKTLGSELVDAVEEALASPSTGIVVYPKLPKTPKAIQSFTATAFEEYEKDKDFKALLAALHTVAQAKGGISKVARKAHMSKTDLEKFFSGKQKTPAHLFVDVLHGLGLRFTLDKV